jgi:hypothetical protein
MSTSTLKMDEQTLGKVHMRGLIGQIIARWSVPVLLIAAAVLLVASLSQPYWEMHLDAVQYEYRGGLDIQIFVDDIQGKDPVFDELRELNNLNHYIGMRKLDEAAALERSIALPSVVAFVVGLVVAAGVHAWKRQWKWTWLLVLPALSFPVVFLADLYYWLRDSGLNLDRTAPFSSSIHPFVPSLLGEGEVGQFATVAWLGTGWYLVAAGSVCILLALAISYWQSRQARQAPLKEA